MLNVRCSLVTAATAAAAFALFAGAGTAQAIPITSLTGATTYEFSALNYQGSGAKTIAPGITWSSQSSGSVYGWTNGYGFAGNGGWNSPLSMIGSNSGSAAMRIDFASPVSGVAAFLNYAPGYGTPTIAVYDSHNTLLESYLLNFSTGGGNNTGQVHGFQESVADIAYMTLSGAYIGAAHLQVLAGNVPEPASYALVFVALAAAGAAVRRRRATFAGHAQVA